MRAGIASSWTRRCRAALVPAVAALAMLGVLGGSPALAASADTLRQPAVVLADDYDGPGGIDGPGEVLCNSIPGRLPILRRGTTNHHWTKLLQAVLGGLEMRPGPVDGVFGAVTQRAVRRFQVANDLIVDGWVGKQTWRSLKREFC